MNREIKFKDEFGYCLMVVSKEFVMKDGEEDADVVHNNIDDKWTLVQNPVDFMTAVKSGKKIKVEHILASHLDITKKYLTLKNLLDTLCYSYPSDAICDILTEGKFYIEE